MNETCREIRGKDIKNVIWSNTSMSGSFLALLRRHAPSAPEDSGPSAKSKRGQLLQTHRSPWSTHRVA